MQSHTLVAAGLQKSSLLHSWLHVMVLSQALVRSGLVHNGDLAVWDQVIQQRLSVGEDWLGKGSKAWS